MLRLKFVLSYYFFFTNVGDSAREDQCQRPCYVTVSGSSLSGLMIKRVLTLKESKPIGQL